MQWRIKGLVQKMLGYLPAGEQAHYLLQRRFGGLRDFKAEFESKVEDWRIMVGHFLSHGFPVQGARLFEIGTGWYPTFPFACYLGGARKVLTFDLNRHLKRELTLACARQMGSHLEVIASTCKVPIADVRARYQRLSETLDHRLDLAGATGGVIDYHAPADARATQLPAGSVDCVFSNSVLEHVPPEVIDGIFRESRRILAPAGMMFHSVNCGDHYAYVDRSITPLQYLRYSDRRWNFWQNAFLYQNRLRAHQFVDMAQRAGFLIALNTAHPTPLRLGQLATVPVHPRFAPFSPEQLCITTVDFISRPDPALPA